MRLSALFCFILALCAPLAARAEVKEITTPSGLSAWLVEDHTLPLIALSFSFESGTAQDPEGKEGLSTLLASTLDEGAGTLPSAAFQEALSTRSISLGFKADDDAFYGTLSTLSREKEAAFKLLKMALTQPRFDAEAVGRMQQALIANRKAALSDPSAIAQEAWMNLAFAPHPYARPSEGTEASLSKLTRHDLITAHAQKITRQGLKIAVVGDITESDLIAALEQVFAPLPEAGMMVKIPAMTINKTPQTQVIKRDQPQTTLMMGLQGITREDPDWFAAQVMNYILGGDFNSRLMEEIRVKRSLTYGIHASLAPFKAGGIFMISASTDNAKAAEVLARTQEQLEKMQQQEVSDSELEAAKNYLAGAFALRFKSSAAIASVLLEVQRLGLPPRYLTERAAQIKAITKADVARVAARILQPHKLMVVAVGQPQNIDSTPAQERAP